MNIILLAFLIIYTAIPAPSIAAVSPTLSISPSKYDLKVEPGQIHEVTVKVTNQSTVAIPIKAEVMDFSPKDDKGAIDFGRSLPGRSAKDWLTVASPDILLDPGASQSVTVAINPPDITLPGSYFAVVMFQASLPSNYFDANASAQIVPWIGELFLLRIGDLPLLDDNSLTITKFSIPRLTRQETIPVSLEVKNNTAYHLAPEAIFQLRSLFGPIAAQTNTKETTIMPGSKRVFEAEIKREWPLGIYRGEALVRVAGYQKTTMSDPLFLLTTIGIIILIITSFMLGHGTHLSIRHRRHLKNRFVAAWHTLFLRAK